MKKTSLFLLSLFTSVVCSAQLVYTIAGSGSQAHADGNGASASFNNPHDVCLDNTGNIYVADQGNHVIRKIDTNGDVTTIAGSPGVSGNMDGTGSAARFYNPSGLAYYNGFLFVTDYSNHLLRRVDVSDGTVTTLAGNGASGNVDGIGSAAQLGGPVGICIFSATEFLFAEQINNKIRKINIATNEVTTFAGSVTGASGSTDGPLANAKFSAPYDVFATMGIVVVADQLNNKIRLIQGGNVSTFAGNGQPISQDGPTLNASFHVPLSLIGNENGDLFVLDYGSAKIRKIDQTAAVTTVVGNGYQFADGDFSVARFNQPTGMTMDSDGNLIIADYGNRRIRKVDFSATAGLSAMDEASITLAPNPCTNELNIQNVQGLSTVVILDVFGKEILKSVSTSIDVSALQSGIYFVQLLTEKGIVQKQFIKQ